MPVDDVEVHTKVRHARPPAGCYNRPKPPVFALTCITFTGEVYEDTMGGACRQIGQRVSGVWTPLPECAGCNADKDDAYIDKARRDIDKEFDK